MGNKEIDPRVGGRIREYQILELIGRGQMGAVYRGRHVFLEEERAVKIIDAGMTSAPEQKARLIREAKVLARLKHPNLVELLDFGTLEDGTAFVVMELLRGETVGQRLQRERKIPVPESIQIVRQAALGLEEAHKQGVLHRDVCPDNIWLTETPAGKKTVKVVDFGIARPTLEETRTLPSSTLLNTRPQYMSPEQFGLLAEGESLDLRTDIYSLAVTLYQMISGELPFHTPVPRGTPAPLSSFMGLPPNLEQIILKDLSRVRNDRHASMKELIADLDRISFEEASTSAQPAQAPKPQFHKGYLFANRYMIEKRLGKGGMGTVYKAIDRILDVPVALKTMNPDLSENQNILTRFKREVILARKVAHPNVCRIYDIGEQGGVHYVSMEFLDGITLADTLLMRGALPLEEGLTIIRQVLLALQEAHRSNVIHRDLKPQNIMVDKALRAYIMDFGISVSSDVSRITSTGMMVGTPRYMAPEQFGEGQADERTDIYSVAVIMFELFTGRLPFEANTPASVMYAHINLKPIRPSEVAPGIPLELERIILKALEKDPRARFQTVSELLAALEGIGRAPVLSAVAATPASGTVTATLPLSRAPSKPVTHTPAFTTAFPEEPRRSPLAATAMGALVVLVVGGASLWLFRDELRSLLSAPPPQTESSRPAEQARQPAQQPPTPETGKPAGTTHETPQEVPPKAEAPETIRKLFIVSEPPKASVFVDGNDTGLQTPATLTVDLQQTHQLELRLAGHVSQKLALDKSAPETIQLSLPPAGPGTIVYDGKYPVSIYEHDQLLLDSSKASSAELPPGSHTLTLISTSGAIIRHTQTIQLRSGTTIAIAAPSMGSLTLTANPSNCKVYVDSVDIGFAPIFEFPVQASNHSVRIVWERLNKERTISIDVAPDRQTTLRAISNEKITDVFNDSN